MFISLRDTQATGVPASANRSRGNMSVQQHNIESSKHRIDALDLLRLAAVMMVMLFHFAYRGAVGEYMSDVSLPAFWSFAKYGNLAVDMFFVISGFVIAYSAEGRTAIEFTIARFSRIYPTFVVCMTVTFLVTLAIGGPRFTASFSQWVANLAIAAPMLKQPFMDGAYWSIVYEVTFYGWVAVLIWAGLFRRYIDVIILTWLAISVINMDLQLAAVRRLFLADESGFFVAGLVLYEFWRGRRDLLLKVLLIAATNTSIVQALGNIDLNRNYYQVPYNDWVVVLLVLIAIGAVALSVFIGKVPLPAALVSAIGGLTYPLYLLHQNIGFMIFNRTSGLASNEVLVGVVTVGLLGISWAVWRFIDRPGQKLAKTTLRRLTDKIEAWKSPTLCRSRRLEESSVSIPN